MAAVSAGVSQMVLMVGILDHEKTPRECGAEASTLSGFSTRLGLLPRKVGLPVGSSSGLSTTQGPNQGCPRVGIRDCRPSNPYRQAFWHRDYRDLVEPFAKQQTVGNAGDCAFEFEVDQTVTHAVWAAIGVRVQLRT